MALNYQVLLVETNVVSLRSAYVIDSDGLVSLTLASADPVSDRPTKTPLSREDYKRLSQDSAWLYRQLRSPADELKLMKEGFDYVSRNIKAISFPKPPELSFLWTDSGHSIALYIDGEAWAFIDEETRLGYSKGILDEAYGKQ